MKNFLLICFIAFFPSVMYSQLMDVVRENCTPSLLNTEETPTVSGGRPLRLPSISNQWDSTRVYRQAVILVSYIDTDFSLENPRETYDSMLNCPGFNLRQGPGCAAEYFREQSGGLFNVQFDVFGPIKVNRKAQPYSKPTENTRNYGHEVFIEATEKLIDSLQVDFTPYDWNGNGYVNQVIYVCAGLTGNQNAEACYGHVWPNTSSFTTITTNGKKISNFTASCEKWANGASCGIGTILHEFTHSLGLPDIYPTTDSAGYSVMDEWDLMDGGNFTNYGWCPPSYTPLEKMLLGWLTPVELTEPQTIRNLKTVANGGEVYRIKHSASEWLMLENRQQEGWDLAAPGKGLLIYHVYYDNSVWRGNSVNNNKNARRFELIHADNMDYDKWYDYVSSWAKPKQYANSGRLNSYLLSTSPYPWTTDSTDVVNDSLTNKSVPPAKMNYPNEGGSNMLSKSISNIVQNADGTITFDFMADVARCATPTIVYENGRIHFECETEGVRFVSKVTAGNAMEDEDEEVTLSTQYVITVYATAEGYADSETVKATLTWSDGKLTGENVDIRDGSFKKGDVNEDGTVDVADISAVIAIMANE
ncbi:MAG: M6 family metalloprotease domain-containing protein [Prevotella sp.]|nr:M6 family metalloprotease domain-containing protein [Prevotella sp.]